MLVGLSGERLAFQTLNTHVNEKGQMCSKHRQEWYERGFQQTNEINWGLGCSGHALWGSVGHQLGKPMEALESA